MLLVMTIWWRTMWTMSATALPGYLASVLRGLRSKKLAPAAWAMDWHRLVLPVLGAPYSNTDLIKGPLHASAPSVTQKLHLQLLLLPRADASSRGRPSG